MAGFDIVIREEDHLRFSQALEQLTRDANAKFVFLLDRAGQQVASAGTLDEVDPTALASLTASNVAATEGVAQIVGERNFSTLFHEGERDSLHISLVAERFILLVAFDERSSLGLVRLRVNQHTPDLGEIAKEVLTPKRSSQKAELGSVPSDAFNGITDEDIDALFG